MENQHGDTDADCPTGTAGLKPGYRDYLDSLCSRRENPSALIVASSEQTVLRVVRACGAVLGPVYHLADPDHASIRAAAARLEPTGPVLAITGERIFLTRAGRLSRCPFCGVFGPAGAASWSRGICPVLAGAKAASAGRLSARVLAALHVLIDEVCDPGSAPGANIPAGYAIDLSAPAPDRTHDLRSFAETLVDCVHRSPPG